MEEHPENLEEYMEKFVELQLSMHEKKAPRLTLQKDKFARKIESMKEKLDATVRYELLTRLDSMPNHTKLCHGDFNPSNVIVAEDGSMKIVDWSHATQGNASGSAAYQGRGRGRQRKKNFCSAGQILLIFSKRNILV